MSDIQNHPVAPQAQMQRQAQQRQILAMMGIEQWVRPNTPTLAIDEIASAPVTSELDSSNEQASINLASDSQAPVSLDEQDGNQLDSADFDIASSNFSVSNLSDMPDTDILPTDNKAADVGTALDVENLEESTAPTLESSLEQLVEKVTAPVTASSFHADLDDNLDNSLNDNLDESLHKVAPFDLQGGRYGNWVLMVDIQALNNDSQKLWQNITQALSLTCESSSFPICEGMDTVELANASLAGYIFKIGRHEDIQVASLTALPEGLTHPNLAEMPTLDEMLADSGLKRELWQQISQ